jgi:DHA1 family bicyclomycin/chloramphenicol resistance-like MFS transporter
MQFCRWAGTPHPGAGFSVGVNTTKPAPGGAWFLVMIGTLTMLPPLSIDISLPGLPRIASALGATPALLQWTLSAFVLAFGAGQLVLGPLSDRYGRRPVLLWGLALYTLAGLGCTYATDARLLIGLRLLQGLGACAGTVCARAIAQDLSSDRAGATFRQSILSAVNSLAPVIAPLLGAAILITLGWRQLYGLLAIVGFALVVMVAVALPETSPRVQTELIGAYRRVLRLPRTIGLATLVGASFFGYFALIAGSSFALIEELHVSSTQFAFAFAINASAFIVAAALSGWLARKINPEILLATGAGIVLLAGILTWALDSYAPSVGAFVATWTLYAFGIAFALPGSMATVLIAARRDAGLAAGLLGAAQMLGGAAGSTLNGALPFVATTSLGIVALTGSIIGAAGYAFSRPALGQQRQLGEARTNDA